MPIQEAAARLAPLFTRKGYAFFYPFRRGQGPSAAPFIQERLAAEEGTHGKVARPQLQDTLTETEQLDDVLAALAFLRSVSDIDASRVSRFSSSPWSRPSGVRRSGALSDGTLARLAADAAGGGAGPDGSRGGDLCRCRGLVAALRAGQARSPRAVRKARCPILLVQWANDYGTEVSTALGAVRERAGPPPVVLLYPAVGSTSEDGHSGLYLAMRQWEPDVFHFLEQAASR
jgi:hypothetical protein